MSQLFRDTKEGQREHLRSLRKQLGYQKSNLTTLKTKADKCGKEGPPLKLLNDIKDTKLAIQQLKSEIAELQAK